MDTAEPTRARRYLFALWDGGGNVPPQLAIARELVARGHEVRILAPRALEGRVTATGSRFAPYRQVPEHDSAVPERDLIQDWAVRSSLQGAARVRDRLMIDPALAFARDVLATLDEEPADVVALDFLVLGAYLGAERAGLPVAAFYHSIYPFPAPGLPPFGTGFAPARGPIGRLRDALFGRLFARFYGAGLPRLNAARDALELAPLASTFDIFARAERGLVLTSRAFDFPTTALPPHVRYVGSPLAAPATESAWSGPWAADDPRPLVVASLSTTVQGQAATLERVIEALSGLPVRALVTTGPALDPAAFPTSANVVVESFIPHGRVLPQADLVITHGGHGTTVVALARGVPVLCLPMGRDQADIAARVAWHGAGLRGSHTARPERLRETVRRMLAEPRYRGGARRLAAAMAREDATANAVAELEGLAGAPRAQLASAPAR